MQGIEGLSQSQWEFKPAAEAWSAALCVEHLCEVEEGVNARIEAILAEGFSDPQLCTEAADKEKRIGKAVPNRTHHAVAPRQPAGRPLFAAKLPAADTFKAVRARTLAFAETTENELDKYVAPHFVFGQLNIYQWLLMLSLHCERHSAQIEEIKANPEFPQA